MKRRTILKFLAIVAALASLLASATLLTAYMDYEFICEHTGSRMGHRKWFFGGQTKEWLQASELEKFIEKDYPKRLTHKWTSYSGKGNSLIPFARSLGHGRPGPIISMDLWQLDQYVRSLPDDKKLELYEIFRSADEDNIRDVADTVWENFPR